MSQIIKERIYAENGVLKRADGNYKVSATDVRYIKFTKDTFKLKFIWGNGKTVSQLVKESGADYGFNFPFFTPYLTGTLPVADCKIQNVIFNRGYDTAGGAQQTVWHGFGYKNDQPVIGELSIDDDYSNGFLVKTTPLLINNNNPCWDWYRIQEGTATDIGKTVSGFYVRAQRTFVGLDAQGNFHLAVSDGRTNSDRGLNLEEMSLYMVSKGVITALNGDGGSSSVIADKSGSLGQNTGTYERVVNHAVLVFMNPIAPPAPNPLDSLLALSQRKQKNGAPFIDYEAWKTLLDSNTPIWLTVELFKRLLEKLEG